MDPCCPEESIAQPELAHWPSACFSLGLELKEKNAGY